MENITELRRISKDLERKDEMYNKLSDSQFMFKTLCENSPNALGMIQLENNSIRILYANPTYCSAFKIDTSKKIL
jgi:PAS domain-containing protein